MYTYVDNDAFFAHDAPAWGRVRTHPQLNQWQTQVQPYQQWATLKCT
jgi:hypothetical protein